MNIPRLDALDKSTTDRGGDILRYMHRTTCGDVDIELSALIGVAAMMFLKINRVPITQYTTDECISRVINALECYYQEIIDGS
jgi:hypothetical protein